MDGCSLVHLSWYLDLRFVYVCSPSCPVCLCVLSSASVFVYLPSRVPMSVSVSLYSFSVITFVVLSLCLRPSCSHVHHLMFHPVSSSIYPQLQCQVHMSKSQCHFLFYFDSLQSHVTCSVLLPLSG